MEFSWENFKNAYKNELEARQGFIKLCDVLMRKLYPDYTIKYSDEISENENKKDGSIGKKCIVYLPKYFLDGVSNSRKGQIRKSLNENLPYMKANQITQWVLLMPLQFSTEEASWWENWSLRIKQENGVTPEVKLGNEIASLASKFGIDFQGLETLEKEQQEPSNDDVMDFDFDYDPEAEEKTSAIEPEPEVKLEVKIAAVKAPEVKVAATAAPESQPEAQPEPEPKPVPEPVLEELISTFDFKTKFEALETEKLELPENQRKVFDERRDESSVKNYLNDFVFGDLSQFTGKDLIKKAQIYVNNEQFSRGLYIYEYTDKKNLVDNILKEDYKRGVNESTFQLNYKYYMIKGDLLFAKRDFINSAESYNKACEIVDSYKETLEEYESDMSVASTCTSLMRDNEALIKYYEAYGEALLQVGEFSKSAEQFSLALDQDPSDKKIQKRYDLAVYLDKGTNKFKSKWLSWLNVFTAPYYYFQARKIDPEIKELEKAEKLRRRAFWGVLLILLLIGAAFALFWFGRSIADSVSSEGGVKAEVSATPLTIQIKKGDYYMERISPETPHYIDSAIMAYQRAIRIDNTDTTAQSGYLKACKAMADYVNQVQQHISTDSAEYFLSMRRPTEGLRLFKYLYDTEDKTKGKFGFVDTLGNVVIAPLFDFNYRTMDGQGETFYNGRAKVCLKVADNDTVYFYIDQRGNKIDE
jgi:tetratricopeptide (TPR) repeat protein